MAKSKLLSVRVTPELRNELDNLKMTFGFTSYKSMIESLVRLMKFVDERISNIETNPSEWKRKDLDRYLPLAHVDLLRLQQTELGQLVLRRLKQRFGEVGVKRLRQLLSDDSSEEP